MQAVVFMVTGDGVEGRKPGVELSELSPMRGLPMFVLYAEPPKNQILVRHISSCFASMITNASLLCCKVNFGERSTRENARSPPSCPAPGIRFLPPGYPGGSHSAAKAARQPAPMTGASDHRRNSSRGTRIGFLAPSARTAGTGFAFLSSLSDFLLLLSSPVRRSTRCSRSDSRPRSGLRAVWREQRPRLRRPAARSAAKRGKTLEPND